MKESVFTNEISHTFNMAGHYIYKIPDAPLSQGMNSGVAFQKPCDLVSSVNGKFIGIETKQIKEFRAFGLYDMRPSQIKHLTEMIQKGARAFVFLNVRINPGRSSKRENRLIVFEWGDLQKRFEEGSIKKGEIMALPFTSKSGPVKIGAKKLNGVFDLKHFYALLNEETISEGDF